MTKRDVLILETLLGAYKRESSALNDAREPERYRQWAQELVTEAERVITSARRRVGA